jgi:trehalose 6-phosphate phosphatase
MLPAPPAHPEQPAALFLDFDGTLVEIAPRPDDIVVPGPTRAILQSLHASLHGALAVVSGRRLENLLHHLAPLALPAAGNHGLEYQLRPGESQLASDARLPEPAREAVEELVAGHPGLLLEYKGQSAAVHFRQEPALGPAVHDGLRDIRDREAQGYMLQAGKMVWELRPAGVSKGSAIRTFMATPPFAGRLAVFLGDDVTDEDGFEVVNELGGWSIHVGPGNGHTVARMGLADVAAVGQWLQSLAGHLRRDCA